MSYQSIKEIPGIGFGLWKIPESTCADVVYEAVKQGYRHFDSASDYGNEKEVGIGLKRAMDQGLCKSCLLYTSPSPRDATLSRMPSSA